MAINPVPGIGSAEQMLSGADPRVQPTQASAQTADHSSAPASGTPSESVTHRPSAASSSNELPKDEVQLLRDQQTNGDVVIKYLDGSGNLVLQVPSPQVLGVARSIIHEFAAEAARAKDDAASPKNAESDGGNHGH